MAEPRAPSAPRTPSSSGSGTPSSASVSGGRKSKGLSLQSIAESLGRASSRSSTDTDAVSAPARHRQLNFDADSVADGEGEDGNNNNNNNNDNNGEQDTSNTPEATQELPEEPEEEAEPESSSEDNPNDGSFDPEETESSSEDDPADETFVPESEESSKEATETESEASAVSEAPMKTRTRSRSRVGTPPSRSRARPRGRRRTVWWTQEEVDFLRNGVREHGLGAWKRILLDGRGIFLSHRTNVDLKDKWMNLIKRYGEDVVMGEAEIDATARARPNPSRQGNTGRGAGSSSSSNKRQRSDSSDSDEVWEAAFEAVRLRTQLRSSAAVNTDSDVGETAGFSPLADEESNQSSQWKTLKIATDDSFPEFVTATVNLATCVDVRALKRRIRVKLLPKISPDAAVPERIQLISIASRRLLGDKKRLSHCLREHGSELYVIPGSP